MWPLRPHPRDDYAPSRMAYRANRFWLSPLARALCFWVLPLAALTAWGTHWAMKPETLGKLRGWQAEVMAHLRAQEEFQVRHLKITGASPQLASEIRRTFPIQFPISVLDLDQAEIKKKVEDFHAVAHVDTHVKPGGALTVTVTERSPVVVWRHNAGLVLLDLEGAQVSVTDRRDGAADLPLIVAAGADRAVPEALALFEAAAPISDRIRGLRRMGERRWDLVLTHDMVIQLPAEAPIPQLHRVIALHEAGGLLNRDLSHVDMRNPDRPTIRLGDQAFNHLRTLRAFQNGALNQ